MTKFHEKKPHHAAALEQSSAADWQMIYREQLKQAYQKSPLPEEDLLFNLGLYTRSAVLVKFLIIHELYKRFSALPGVLMEFGTWWGQNIILLENCRAIHEPFNKQRRIIGFDTFDGYKNLDEEESLSPVFNSEQYRTKPSYQSYLAELIKIHEGNNAFGHIQGNHELVPGDVTETVPQYFVDHPETLVAFAYFDMGSYRPTLAALQALKPHLVPGAVLLFDELTWAGATGEAMAFKKVFVDMKYEIEKCVYYPSKAIVTIKG
jgi:hypothetical protein